MRPWAMSRRFGSAVSISTSCRRRATNAVSAWWATAGRPGRLRYPLHVGAENILPHLAAALDRARVLAAAVPV